MSIQKAIPLGRGLKGDNVISLYTLKSVGISEAASSPEMAIRKQEHDAAITAITGGATTLTNFGAVESSVSTLDGRLDTVETGVSTLDGRVDVVEVDVASLQSRADGVDVSVASLGTRITAVEDAHTNQTVVRSFAGPAVSWALQGDGSYVMTVPHTFGTSELTYQIQESIGNGAYRYFSDNEVAVMVNTTEFRIATLNPSIAALTLRVVATGSPVV